MRTLDLQGNEITDPDLEAGYLIPDTITIHHPAVPDIPKQVITVKANDDPKSKLLIKKTIQEHVPGALAWDEKVPIQRYIPYTPEELAEREREREEMEAAAAEAAAKQAVMDALPDAFDELAEQTADSAMTIEVVCSAVEELAEMVASQSQNGGE